MPDDTPAGRYVRGESYARRSLPRFEFKASSPGHTGGGYPRVRSTERRAHTAREGTEDVAVSIHRLAAVAWHLPDGVLGRDVFLSDLDGQDVHHTQPDRDERGMPAANGEAWTEVIAHDRHSAVTQAERRAWAADQKRLVDGAADAGPACAGCGEPTAEPATVDGATYCLACASDVAERTGATIEL